MSSTNVTITGDIEVINYFRLLGPRVESFLEVEIDDIAQELRNEMMRRMHRQSGDMANSTRVETIPNGKAVTVNVSYADLENSRPGVKKSKSGSGQGTQHRFVEPSMDIVTKTKVPQMVLKLRSVFQ